MQLESNHADEEQLEQYSLGRLPESEVATLEEHLLICAQCRAHLDETDEYVQAMRAAMRSELGERPPPGNLHVWDRSRSLRKSLIPIAALALLGVAGSQYWNRPTSTPVRVQLYAMRGQAPSQAGVANRPLDLLVDARGIPARTQYRLQVVNLYGQSVWEGSALPEGVNLHGFANTKLAQGSYFVRVFGEGPDALREYSLAIR